MEVCFVEIAALGLCGHLGPVLKLGLIEVPTLCVAIPMYHLETSQLATA